MSGRSSQRLQWDSGRSTVNTVKSNSGHEFNSLSRCAGCYNQHKSTKLYWLDDCESSSSAEDSGSEADSESEPESSCSSSSSKQVLAEISKEPKTEKHPAVSGDAAEGESGGQDGDGQAGETSESQEDKKSTKKVIQRAPLVKSFSLPSSFTPHLIPLSFLPRVISTLHLEVLQQEHNSDTFYRLHQHLPEREKDKIEESKGRINKLLPPQPFQQWRQGLPWQQEPEPKAQQHQHQPHQYRQQQQQPQLFCPLSAQGQRLPSPPFSLPALPRVTLSTPLQAPHVPQTHLHALTPQTCSCYYRMHFPYTYGNH